MTRQEFKNRRDLLKQVKNEVEGRLRQSLHCRMGALINLEKEAQPEQVRRIWDVDVKIGDRPGDALCLGKRRLLRCSTMRMWGGGC